MQNSHIFVQLMKQHMLRNVYFSRSYGRKTNIYSRNDGKILKYRQIFVSRVRGALSHYASSVW